MEPEYFTDEDGNLVERTVSDRVYLLDDLKMKLLMLRADHDRVSSEIARLSNLLEQFSKVE